jgi:hypothetical protein
MLKRGVVFLFVVAVSVVTYQITGSLLIAKAVLPPSSSRSQIVRSALKPAYQMATPHRTPLSIFRSYVSKKGTVCAAPDCDSTHAQPACNSNCFGFCGHCPDCVNGPCTIYNCVFVIPNVNSKCVMEFNTQPCDICRRDKDVNCRKVF